MEDKYYLDSRLSEVVCSDCSSESDTPLASSQVTIPLVINDNFNDVCSSLQVVQPCFSSRISSSVGISCQSFVSPHVPLFEPSSFVMLHNLVYAMGRSNFLGAHLSVPTSLNLSLWRSSLTQYSDAVVCDYLEFGWPIGHNFHNHRGALDVSSAIDSYLSTELALGSICSPFARNPIALFLLNSVPKLDSNECRFILDLSWPAGSSVNDGISKDFFLGEPVLLTYPTVDDIAARIIQLGPGCLFFKSDLKCAYHQLQVDPFDYHLLGYSWRDKLFF